MRREGKPGPFIPFEVPAQTGPAQVTMPTPARRRRRVTRAVGARAKRPRLGDDGWRVGGVFFHKHNAPATASASGRRYTRAPRRQLLCPCDDECCAGGVFFHQHPKLQRSGDDVCVRATMPASGRQRVRPADNACARATTGAAWEGFFFTNTPNFNARAMTSVLARRRLDPIVLTLAFFFAFAIQTKLFHYLFSRITQIVLKMVIQSYFY